MTIYFCSICNSTHENTDPPCLVNLEAEPTVETVVCEMVKEVLRGNDGASEQRLAWLSERLAVCARAAIRHWIDDVAGEDIESIGSYDCAPRIRALILRERARRTHVAPERQGEGEGT